MSRHRNVRSLNYSEEYDGYEDVYGHSVEDDYSVSPSDAGFIYDRSREHQISAFLGNDIQEEDETAMEEANTRPCLGELDEAKLRSCIEEITNVIGETVPLNIVEETVLRNGFDVPRSLDSLLSESSKPNTSNEPKSQRERRDRASEKDDNLSANSMSPSLESSNKFIIPKLKLEFKKTNIDSTNLERLNISPTIEEEPINSIERLMLNHQKSNTSIHQSSSGSDMTASTPSASSLAELSEMLLMSTIDTTKPRKFILPKLNKGGLSFKSNSLESTTTSDCKPFIIPTFPSLIKNNKPLVDNSNLTNLFLKEDSPDNWIIDLTSALKTEVNIESPEKKVEILPEILPTSAIIYSDNFEYYDAQELLKINCESLKRKCSSFGHVVCKSWNRQVVHVDVIDNVRENIKRFKFDTPSPDDKILNILKRK